MKMIRCLRGVKNSRGQSRKIQGNKNKRKKKRRKERERRKEMRRKRVDVKHGSHWGGSSQNGLVE